MTAIVGALIFAGAPAAVPGSTIPPVLRTPLAKVKATTRVPVLLPSALPSTLAKVRLYSFATATQGRYDVTLASRPRCGANACFVGAFSGKRGGRPLGARPVALTGGRKGRYTPLSSGASCSPPSIEWAASGYVYNVTMNVEWRVQLSSARERTLMVELADSAIGAGPR